MTARLSLVILAVADLQRSRAFYCSAFGWPVTVDTPVYVELELPAEMRLGLYLREAFTRNTVRPLVSPASPNQSTAVELYIYPDNVLQSAERLLGAGADQLTPLLAREWGDEAMYFADPDRNIVVLARRVSAQESVPLSS